MQAWGMDTAGLQLDPHKPTGVVDIRFQDKHHSFDILADQAYDHLDAGLGREALGGIEPALAYHGTLVMRTLDAKRALDELLSSDRIKTFVDVNLRDPWWRKDDLPSLLERAAWVKVNDEELTIVSEIAQLGTRGMEATARALRSRYDLDLLIVTLGANGAVAFDYADEVVYVEPDGETEVVDTVGAGDAFSSVVLHGLLEGWPVSQIMRRAQDFAGRICAQRGATSRNPALYETVRS
jgi:fructokinase